MAMARRLARSARLAALVLATVPATAGCAGVNVDWRSVGAGVVDKACRNSSHCDLPCSRDRARRDCNSGGRSDRSD